MTKFEVGKKYSCRSIADRDCIFEFEIVKRTEKTVVIKDGLKEKRCKIHSENEEEYIYPLGKYSMCPTLRSSKEMTEKTQDIVKQEIKTQDIEVQTTNNVTYVDFQKPEEKETETSIYYEINEKVAAIANDMVSFSKYEQGSATAEYRKLVDKAAKIAEQKKKETDPMYHPKITYYFDLYARKLAENINRYYEISTRCPSVMIVGPAKFPVKKKERQVYALNKNFQEYNEIQKILEKIQSIGKGGIRSDDPRAIEKLKERLLTLEKNQEHMKKVNAYYRKNKTLEGCGILSENEKKLLTSFMERNEITSVPYGDLSNNYMCIKHTKERIAELEARDSLKGWKFEAGEVVANKEINRLQILFDEKPEEEVRNVLKRNGFKWACSQKAWQRLLNQNAIFAAKRVLKSFGKEIKV